MEKHDCKSCRVVEVCGMHHLGEWMDGKDDELQKEVESNSERLAASVAGVCMVNPDMVEHCRMLVMMAHECFLVGYHARDIKYPIVDPFRG